jgi:hypothetical protein
MPPCNSASRRDATSYAILRLPPAGGGDERSELQPAAWGGGRLPTLTDVKAETDTESDGVGRIPDGMRKEWAYVISTKRFIPTG